LAEKNISEMTYFVSGMGRKTLTRSIIAAVIAVNPGAGPGRAGF